VHNYLTLKSKKLPVGGIKSRPPVVSCNALPNPGNRDRFS
jgi:hypothetical protein